MITVPWIFSPSGGVCSGENLILMIIICLKVHMGLFSSSKFKLLRADKVIANLHVITLYYYHHLCETIQCSIRYEIVNDDKAGDYLQAICL